MNITDKQIEFISLIARMNYDGEELPDGEEFLMENDDAVMTLNELIHVAREMLEPTNQMKLTTDIETLIAQARPIDDSDYGSERQIEAENAVYLYVESVLSAKQFAAFEHYANKATVDERLDAALYVVNGDVNWLDKWN